MDFHISLEGLIALLSFFSSIVVWLIGLTSKLVAFHHRIARLEGELEDGRLAKIEKSIVKIEEDLKHLMELIREYRR